MREEEGVRGLRLRGGSWGRAQLGRGPFSLSMPVTDYNKSSKFEDSDDEERQPDGRIEGKSQQPSFSSSVDTHMGEVDTDSRYIPAEGSDVAQDDTADLGFKDVSTAAAATTPTNATSSLVPPSSLQRRCAPPLPCIPWPARSRNSTRNCFLPRRASTYQTPPRLDASTSIGYYR